MSEKYTPKSDDPWAREREEKENIWSKITNMSNHIDSVIILSLISCLFYVFITSYYISYFQRLSISFYILDLPLTFYLYAAKQLLVCIFFIISIYYIIDTIVIFDKNFVDGRKYGRLVGLILCYSVLILGYIYLLKLFNTENVFYIIFPPIFYILYVKSYKNRVKDKNGFIFLNIFLIYLVIFVYIPILGNNSAENLLIGNEGSLKVKLDLKDVNHSLSNETLILVTHSNGKYFLIEQNKSKLKNPNLYIIPDDQIKMITIIPVEKGPKRSYDFEQYYYKFLKWMKNIGSPRISVSTTI